MIHAIWEFRVNPEHSAEFQRVYGPEGDWAQLFRRHAAYCGTELLRDRDDTLRFLTVDRWRDLESYNSVKLDSEYTAIDAACERLTASERLIGIFETES